MVKSEEFRMPKMAGDEKTVLGFQQKVSSKDVISWSDDHRLLLCTDGGIHILDMMYAPHQLESTPQFQRQFIPQPQEPCNLTGLALNNFLKLKDSLDYSELQPVMLDRTLCPFVMSNCSYRVFKAACWSPPSADVMGRCIVSALTYDHRLILYTSGSSKNQWKQIVELSQLYYNHFEDTLDKKFTSYEKLKSSVYKLAAMEMAWSPLLKDDVNGQCVAYSLLAVGMKSGHLVLWKIKFPCLSEEDCELTQTFALSSSHFTSLSWNQTVDCSGICYVVSGHHDGTIHMAGINTKDGTVSSNVCLYSETDLMEVTCICVKPLPENRLCVLGTKETFITSVLMELIDKKMKIISVSHTTGDNTLYATGLCVKENQIFMSSIDCVVQKLQLHSTDTDIKVQSVPVNIKYVPEAVNWSCHGITLSKNGIFLAVLACLKNADKKKEKKVTKIFIHTTSDADKLKQKVEEHLLNNEVSCNEIADVMELFREYLWTGQNIVPRLTDYLSQPDLFDVPFKMLKLLRFLLMVIKLHIPSVQEGEENAELVLTEDNIAKVTYTICGKYIHECFKNFLQLESYNIDYDFKVCISMMKWVLQNQDRFEKTMLWELLPKVKKIVGDDLGMSCAVCDSELTYDKLIASCQNGHNFAVCCKTFAVCDEVPNRMCQVCKAQFRSRQHIQGLHWLADEKMKCTLCDGLII